VGGRKSSLKHLQERYLEILKGVLIDQEHPEAGAVEREAKVA
jgi:hypothetical protein